MGKMTRRVARTMGVQRPAANTTKAKNTTAETAEPQKKNLFQKAVGWLNKGRNTNAPR